METGKVKYSACLLCVATIFACIGCGDDEVVIPGDGEDVTIDITAAETVEYTIRLNTESGLMRNENIKALKGIYRERMGWDDTDMFEVCVSHDVTSLFYNRFDSMEKASAKLRELRAIRVTRQDNFGEYSPFFSAIVIPLPGQDVGPDKWNLEKADGYYSVCVGVWHNDPKKKIRSRKTLAVAHCKELRDKGHEAYFYHGESQSLVTIGVFGKDAVRMVKKYDRHGAKLTPETADRRARAILKEFEKLAVNGWSQSVSVAVNPNRPLPEGVELHTGKDGVVTPVKWVKTHMVHMPGKRPVKEKDKPESIPEPHSPWI